MLTVLFHTADLVENTQTNLQCILASMHISHSCYSSGPVLWWAFLDVLHIISLLVILQEYWNLLMCDHSMLKILADVWFVINL